MSLPVLVGTDGSSSAIAAVRWAAAEAGRRGVALHVIHVWVWPLMKVRLGPAPGAPAGAGLQAQADMTLAEAAAAARDTSPGLAVTESLLVGDVAARLVAASREAQLLVVGNRGLGGFAGLLLGSVSASVMAQAACPTVVVRGRPQTDGPVVVGVDEGGAARVAVDAAFAAAHRVRAGVLAVHAYRNPGAHSGAVSAARALLERELAVVREKNPSVPVTTRLSTHSPARELVDASEGAQLVVVGERGSGGFASLVVGTTSIALCHHAHCPVLVQR